MALFTLHGAFTFVIAQSNLKIFAHKFCLIKIGDLEKFKNLCFKILTFLDITQSFVTKKTLVWQCAGLILRIAWKLLCVI